MRIPTVSCLAHRLVRIRVLLADIKRSTKVQYPILKKQVRQPARQTSIAIYQYCMSAR